MYRAACRYARNGDARIAYQVIGQGSIDLVLVPGFPSNIEVFWEDPGFARLVKRLSTFSRLIVLDPRGTGLSDRVDPLALPGIDTRAEDIRAVMDAAGCGSAALFGTSDGAALALLFAVNHPARTRALILHGGYAAARDRTRRPPSRTTFDAERWGKGETVARMTPGRERDPSFAEWRGRLERMSASPSAAMAQARMADAIDVRSTLPQISVPTLVLHRAGDAYCEIDAGRRLAGAIRGARMVELDGSDHPVWAGDVDSVADRVEEFLVGQRPVVRTDRVLAMLVVVRVQGTSASGTAGRHLDERMELLRDELPKIAARFGGRGRWFGSDRLDLRFDGAARALNCAVSMHEAATALGLGVAQGVHAGEIEPSAEVSSGAPLEVAAAIAAAPKRPEILLSRLASDLVSGSGLQFVDRGTVTFGPSVTPVAVVGLARERHLEPVNRSKAQPAELAALTNREREVLALVAEGLSNPFIAVQLGLSVHTVKRHVANILLKLDIPTRAAAAGLVARQAGS